MGEEYGQLGNTISIIASLIAQPFHTVKWWLVLGAASRRVRAVTNTHAHTHACKQWFVTSLRNACCLISARSPQAPFGHWGGPSPVNDKPIVFGRVEPFRCKSLHFSSHTQPHNSALECSPLGHSRVDCISPRNLGCKPASGQLVGEKKNLHTHKQNKDAAMEVQPAFQHAGVPMNERDERKRARERDEWVRN